MSGIEALLKVAEAYRTAESISLSTVSWRALSDTKKLQSLVNGRDIQVGRLERAFAWFSDNWPAEAAWPPDVPRPARSAAEPEGAAA